MKHLNACSYLLKKSKLLPNCYQRRVRLTEFIHRTSNPSWSNQADLQIFTDCRYFLRTLLNMRCNSKPNLVDLMWMSLIQDYSSCDVYRQSYKVGITGHLTNDPLWYPCICLTTIYVNLIEGGRKCRSPVHYCVVISHLKVEYNHYASLLALPAGCQYSSILALPIGPWWFDHMQLSIPYCYQCATECWEIRCLFKHET